MRQRLHENAEVVGTDEAFFEDEGDNHGMGSGSGYGQVVHGTVDGEFADGAAGEAQGADHEAVGGKGDGGPADFDVSRVGETLGRAGEKQRREEAFDESAAGFASGAMGHLDLWIFEPDLRRSFGG